MSILYWRCTRCYAYQHYSATDVAVRNSIENSSVASPLSLACGSVASPLSLEEPMFKDSNLTCRTFHRYVPIPMQTSRVNCLPFGDLVESTANYPIPAVVSSDPGISLAKPEKLIRVTVHY